MQHANRVLERLPRQDVGRPEILRHELDDPTPRSLARAPCLRESTAGMAAPLGSVIPSASAIARHRRCRAHDHAVPGRARQAVLDLTHSAREPARSKLLPVAPAVAPRADLLRANAREHRAAGHHDGRDIRARRPHEHRRIGLVTTREEHDAVEGQAPDELLDVHGHEVPEEHRRRLHKRLAERDHGELEREPAGAQDTPLDVHRHGAEMRVAVTCLTPGVRDPDHWAALEGLIGKPADLSHDRCRKPLRFDVSNHCWLRRSPII